MAGPAESMDALERVRGWRDTLNEHGLVAHEPILGDWSAASGYAAGQRLLGEHFTAAFCGKTRWPWG